LIAFACFRSYIRELQGSFNTLSDRLAIADHASNIIKNIWKKSSSAEPHLQRLLANLRDVKTAFVLRQSH
jgi:hypothetical protein